MPTSETRLDQQTFVDTYQSLIDKGEFSKREFFELCRDVLRVRRLSEVILNGDNIEVELKQLRSEEIRVEFVRVKTDDGIEDVIESWDITSHAVHYKGRERFDTTFYFMSGVDVSIIAGEVAGLGSRIPDANLELNGKHMFKLAKAVWDSYLNSP